MSALPLKFWYLFISAVMLMFALAFYQDTIVLHLTTSLHINVNRSYAINGIFASAVYLTAAFCGVLSGKCLTSRRSIILGFSLMALGAFAVANHQLNFFILGLVLFVIGYGFVFTNIFYLVGSVFSLTDSRRESGFTLAYIALNIGALLGLTLGGFAIEEKSFANFSFFVAALLIVFVIIFRFKSQSTYRDVDAMDTKIIPVVIYIVVLTVILYFAFKYALSLQIVFTVISLLIVAAIFIFAISRWRKNKLAAKKLFLLGGLTIVSIFYWSAYRMQDNFILLFIQHHVQREIFNFHIPAPTLLGINPLFILLFGPVVSYLWASKKAHKFNNPIVKTGLSLFILGLGFVVLTIGAMLGFPVSMLWVVVFLLLLSFAELILGPTSFSMVGQLAEKQDQLIMLGLVRGGMSAAGIISGIIAIHSNNYLKHVQPIAHGYVSVYLTIALILLFVGLGTIAYRRLYFKWS